MPPAEALHRHQSSLEGIIDFTTQPPLTLTQRHSTSRRFNQLASYFDVSDGSSEDYDRVKLVRLTYEYARSEESKDNFLRAFFESAGLSIDIDEDIDLSDADRRAELRDSFFNFAEYLFENFFLPLKSSTKKTPQPSPASHSAVQRAQGGEGHNFLGTPERLSTLRGACLIRDRHRCIITRRFDDVEAFRRIHDANRHGAVAKDDDGSSLEEEDVFDTLEVAHILPHSLTQVNASNELNPSKAAALAILNMFDSGAAFLIEGTEIDRPRNAMTLTHTMHRWFGDFQIFFEPIHHQQHTYRINTFVPMILKKQFPITRTLYLTESRTIDPPSPRLLAIHNAIAHILHLSAAGEYIDRILRDLEQHGVREDGSTEIDRLVKLRLDGWSASEVQG